MRLVNCTLRARRTTSVVAALGLASAVLFATADPALAKPSDIDYTMIHSAQLGYSANAIYYAGSGSIRATLGCDSGAEHYTIYGPWKSKSYTFSQTGWCANASTNYYQIK